MLSGRLSQCLGALAAKTDDRADLSERSDFLLALFDDTQSWRERRVEELTFGSGVHVRASTALQIDFPPALLEQFVDLSRVRRANLLVPLGTREKRPLLGLNIIGHGGAPAHLVPRASIAALETLYLEFLVSFSPAAQQLGPRLPGGLLEAICVFSPDLFRSFLAEEADVPMVSPEPIDVALARYLASGLDLEITPGDVRTWRAQRTRVGDVLTRHLGEQRSVVSSSEEVLLAIPRVDPLPSSKDEIESLVFEYNEAVLAADAAGDDVFLSVLAEYGRRYEMIVETEIPLLEPATITVGENRSLNLRAGGQSRQLFALGEARSAHFEGRVSDPSVTVTDFDVRTLDGEPARLGPLESVKHTSESVSLYSSEPDRPFYAIVTLRLRPRRHLRWTSYLLIALNVGAAVTALIIGTKGQLEARLAILIVPTTLSATFALVREQTALSVRLQQRARLLLGVSVGLLWGIALAQLLVSQR
jgi:hypothetical protein